MTQIMTKSKLKICIIGCGFYGAYIAKKLGCHYTVDIYEKNSKPCLESIVNNQNRLHLGYHYPRCEKTILQTISTYEKFLKEFNNCVSFSKNNIYAIHEESKVSYKDYKKTFDNFKLTHEEVSINDDIWKDIKNKKRFLGAIRTKEGIINCQKIVMNLMSSIYNNKNISIYCNQKITDDKFEKFKKNYDYVINCTYIDPFIGMKKTIEAKEEACLIAVIKNKRYKDFGFTIMDGPFCSLYPVNKEVFSLSSVLYTPYNSTIDSFCLDDRLKSIIEHGEEYFYLENSSLIDFYHGKKKKIKNDYHDERYSFILKEENVISVFSGKISSVIDIYSEILNEIK